MNYIISSVILLVVILIIIYILSIDNNIDKFKNKFKEIFSVVKSKKINYLNERDNLNLLNYIKHQFKSNDNVTIPDKIYYNNTEKGYELNNVEVICYSLSSTTNTFEEVPYIVDILFVPFQKEHYISNQSLLGLHGNFMMNIKESKKVTRIPSEHHLDEMIIQPDIQTDNNTDDIMNIIPDIVHLTEDNSEADTTDTDALIAHNFK